MPKKSNAVDSVQIQEPATSIKVNKEQAGEVSIGDKISITISGEVKGIRESYFTTQDGKPKYWEIELRPSKVDNIGGNKADKSLKSLKG